MRLLVRQPPNPVMTAGCFGLVDAMYEVRSINTSYLWPKRGGSSCQGSRGHARIFLFHRQLPSGAVSGIFVRGWESAGKTSGAALISCYCPYVPVLVSCSSIWHVHTYMSCFGLGVLTEFGPAFVLILYDIFPSYLSTRNRAEISSVYHSFPITM